MQVANSYLLPQELADLGGPRVRDGDDLDQLRILDLLGLCSREQRLKADAPVGAEPGEGLQGDDGAAPHVGPLGRADVLLVERGRQVVAQEDGPEDGEGPHVGVEVAGQRLQKLRRLDLRVFDERHGGGRDGGASAGSVAQERGNQRSIGRRKKKSN